MQSREKFLPQLGSSFLLDSPSTMRLFAAFAFGTAASRMNMAVPASTRAKTAARLALEKCEEDVSEGLGITINNTARGHWLRPGRYLYR